MSLEEYLAHKATNSEGLLLSIVPQDDDSWEVEIC